MATAGDGQTSQSTPSSLRQNEAGPSEATSISLDAAHLAGRTFLLGNDAGFAHLASGLGVKTVTLYGMTDPVRSQPVGESIAVRPSSCPPCHDEGMRTFACVLDIGYRCSQEDLAVDDAMDAIDRAFAASALAFEPAESGDYRLYGRPVKIVPATSAIDSTAHSKAEASEIASGT